MYEQPSAQAQWQWLRTTAVFFASLFSIIYLAAGFIGILG
jgi:hypothetical protein